MPFFFEPRVGALLVSGLLAQTAVAQSPDPSGSAAAGKTVPAAQESAGPSLDDLQAEAARLRADIERLRQELGDDARADGDGGAGAGTDRKGDSARASTVDPAPQAKPAAAPPQVEPPQAPPRPRNTASRPAPNRPAVATAMAERAPSRASIAPVPAYPGGSLPPPFFAMRFEPGRVKLADSSLVELANTIDALHVAEAAAVLVVGFSDTAGDPRFNERLAIGRAQTVQAVLVAFGIDPDKITAVGNHELGAAPPIVTPQGRSEAGNRVAYIYLDDTARRLVGIPGPYGAFAARER